jgi:transposase, IS5 family
MEAQLTFSDIEWRKKCKTTRRELFLAEMERAVPWAELEKLVRPHAPKEEPGIEGGRPANSLAMMLRVYFCQQWYQLSDDAMEDTLYDIESVRRFCVGNNDREPIPDASSITRFRHMLEAGRLQEKLFKRVNKLLEEKGILMREGTIVDATIIHAPSSTKNREGKRDPEMTQTKKGNQWFFGMKCHTGVDNKSGLIHTVRATTAKASDLSQLHALLHGQEREVLADRAYCSEEEKRFWAKHGVRFLTPTKKKPGQELSATTKLFNRRLSARRAIVEHPFHVIKRIFGYQRTRYRGILKNYLQQVTLAFLANLYKLRHSLNFAPA